MLEEGISRIPELKKYREIIFSVVYIQMGIVKHAKTAYEYIKKKGKKRYVNKKGIKLVQVAKDVMMLKNVLNPEKKRIQTAQRTDPTNPLYQGQVNSTVSAMNYLIVTPQLVVGTGYSDRNGASVKLHSSHYQFQIQQFTSANAPARLKFMIVKNIGKAIQAGAELDTFISNMFQPNPFITGGSIIDYNSQLNPDYFGTYKILAQKKVRVSNDFISGQQMFTNFTMGLKYNKGKGHHLRWDKNSTTLLDGQLILIILSDSGNVNASTTSTLGGVPITAPDTGQKVFFNRMDYFYDN